MGKVGLIATGVVAASLLVAACGAREPLPTRPVGVVVVPPGADGSLRSPRMPDRPVSVQNPGDLCRASDLQWLVGRDRSEIPVPVDITNRRVACTTCPRTEPRSPYLLNILYDASTGRVTEVSCG